MTGLDDTKDHILEAACLVTDENLNIVAEGPSIVIHQPSSILESMNEWCIKTHTEVIPIYNLFSMLAHTCVFFYSLDLWRHQGKVKLDWNQQKTKF